MIPWTSGQMRMELGIVKALQLHMSAFTMVDVLPQFTNAIKALKCKTLGTEYAMSDNHYRPLTTRR